MLQAAGDDRCSSGDRCKGKVVPDRPQRLLTPGWKRKGKLGTLEQTKGGSLCFCRRTLRLQSSDLITGNLLPLPSLGSGVLLWANAYLSPCCYEHLPCSASLFTRLWAWAPFTLRASSVSPPIKKVPSECRNTFILKQLSIQAQFSKFSYHHHSLSTFLYYSAMTILILNLWPAVTSKKKTLKNSRNTIYSEWKQPTVPLTEEGIKKMWYVHTAEYYSAIKTQHCFLQQHGWT